MNALLCAIMIFVAIKANARLIDLFFSTMELKIEAEKLPAVFGVGTGYQEFQLKGRILLPIKTGLWLRE